ncbi:MAG: InlB B-repeat-containing protein [Atopobiaceae bacterium]|nr:InlB B-repeat-containing protein [Atopobiaceae bacterium]
MRMKAKRFLSVLLTLALVSGLVPGEGLKEALADSATYTIVISEYFGSHTYSDSATLPISITANEIFQLCGYDTTPVDTSLTSGTNVAVSGNTVTVNGEGTSEILINYDDGHMTDSEAFRIAVTQNANVAVTSVSLSPDTAQTIDVGGNVAFTASVEPGGATDRKVLWSVAGDDASAVELYADEACQNPVGTEATDILTVYAKGMSASTATVTATSNADSSKSANCDVTVNEVHTHDDITFTPWTSANGLPTDGGNYYLTTDVTLTSQWVVSAEISLCLNGHTITQTVNNNRVIDIAQAGMLNLYECAETAGAINGATITINHFRGGCVNVSSGGTFNMYGGIITKSKMTANGNYGAGVNVNSGGKFSMYKGAITENTVGQNGCSGGVYSEGTFNMYDGTISKNNGQYGAGVRIGPGGTGTMSGGIISENVAGKRGAGVYIEGVFTMSDGTISGNHVNGEAKYGGGGVFVQNQNGTVGTFNMSGGTISGNSSGTHGGGICLRGYGSFSGSPIITGNSATTHGGGICIEPNDGGTDAGSVSFSGNPTITGNTVKNAANNVYITEGSVNKNKLITIGENGLTEGTSIAVTMQTPGAFTVGYSSFSSTAPSTYFSSDNTDYGVVLDVNREAMLVHCTVVTFDANGHGTAPAAQTVAIGSTVTKPDDLTADGYTFGGWYKEAGCANAWNFDSDTASTAMTLYAKWTTVPATAPTVAGAADLALTYGYTAGSVSVTAAPADGHAITGYQWYSNTTNSAENGTEISGATEASYPIPTGKSADTTECYYCVVTAKRTDNDQTATATSEVATVTVGKANPTATAPTASATYGQTLADVTLSNPEGNTPGSWAWVDEGTTSVGSAGSHTFKANFTPTDTANYKSVSNVDVTVTIGMANAAAATVTANNRTYDGTEKPLVTVDNSTLVGGTMQYALGTATEATESYATSIPVKTDAGTYYVWYKAAGDENHEDSAPVCVKAVVSPAKATLAWSKTSFTYDAKSHKPTAKVSNLAPGTSCSVTVSGEKADAGTYAATATELSNKNYVLPKAATTKFTIGKAKLTVTAKDKAIAFGAAPANAGVSYAGFKGSDSAKSLGGKLAYGYGGYRKGSKPGTYKIEPSGLTSTNYDIAYKAGALTVTAPGRVPTTATGHLQGTGDTAYGASAKFYGTTGRSKRLEALRLKLSGAPYAGSIQYRSHLQGRGWESKWASDGAMSGTVAQSRRIEAVQVRLTSEMAKHYDVYYRVHVQGAGWMAWAKNGASAGTEGQSRRAEAVQVVILKKGSKAPGKTYNDVTQAYARAFVSK